MKTDKIRVLCPACGGKTRVMVTSETEIKDFPLFCPKCKAEITVDIKDGKITRK